MKGKKTLRTGLRPFFYINTATGSRLSNSGWLRMPFVTLWVGGNPVDPLLRAVHSDGVSGSANCHLWPGAEGWRAGEDLHTNSKP
ncbi:hypothetical protein N7488_006403 [Penicillium malachiteum]|nr:hypothetical protein N7488_006403 [Penicillium malachiteum]